MMPGDERVQRGQQARSDEHVECEWTRADHAEGCRQEEEEDDCDAQDRDDGKYDQ